MAKDVNYNSLKERLNELNKDKPKYSKIRGTIKNTGMNSPHLQIYENAILSELRGFNKTITKGDFEHADNYAREIEFYLTSEKDGFQRNPLDKESRLKYLEAFNKRVERGIKYLEKKENVTEEEKENLKRILSRSNVIGDYLRKPSSLEKSLAVLSIGSVLAGIFFLSPNLTGNVIGNVAKNSGNILGGVLFILGIVGAFFTLKK